MAVKQYKPTTPSRRNMSSPSFAEVTKFTPEKSLIVTKKKNAGRNSYGKITVRHHGGGNKQKYRIIDFKRNVDDFVPLSTKRAASLPASSLHRCPKSPLILRFK